MAINRPPRIAATVALALTAGSLLALTGCSPKTSAGGTASPPATSALPATSAPSTAPAPASGQRKLDGVPSACPSANVVMSNLHLTSLVVSGGDPSFCEYLFNGDKSKPYVAITFNAAPGMTADQLKKGLTQEQTDVQTVPGLADAAFSFAASPGKGLTFLSGDTVCSILTTVPTTTSEEVALANAILQG